jgi:phage gp37-like protein
MTLRDAIDKDQFIIEKVCYLDDELKAMSLDGLETLKMQITKKISGLSLALKETDGNFSMGKKRALYINQRVLIYVNSLIKKHGQKKMSLADHFFVQARAVLPPMLFEQILSEAQASMRAQK